MSANTAEKLETYPALAEMGIIRFHEISHYSLRQDGESKDILRVKYKRAKGSLLPYSRKYKFGRSLKSVLADGGTARIEHTYEVSPFLLKAVSELDKLVSKNQLVDAASIKSKQHERVAKILTEVDELDQLLDDSINSGNASIAKAKIAVLRDRLNDL